MVRTRPKLPHGHGELLTQPEYQRWAEMSKAASERAAAWGVEIGGVPIGELRLDTRAQVASAAATYSKRLGIPVADVGSDPPERVVVTGHQPDLYHPGVWAKSFLLQRLSDDVDALAINLVVDSDTFDTLGITAPCLGPEVKRCSSYLAVGAEGACYACTPVPSASDIREFCSAGEEMLATLPTPALSRHFSEFCRCLSDSASEAKSLAELVTFARRRYESSADTHYLELPVTEMARLDSFRHFFASIALDADAFALSHNGELDRFRDANGIRTPAQPFPNLSIDDGWVELPFWGIDERRNTGSGRIRLWARSGDTGAQLRAGDIEIEIGSTPQEAAAALADSGILTVPRAITLTLFVRLLVADLFIHGVGGGSYDRVTDAIIRSYMDIEPPEFVVASLTMYLPLGGHVVTDEEIAEARRALNTLEHNPDQLLADVSFDSVQERLSATRLGEDKAALVQAIAEPDADKKTIGTRIRKVNEELSRLLAPVREEREAELSRLEGLREASEILTDRTYPFCFWSPEEVQDKTG